MQSDAINYKLLCHTFVDFQGFLIRTALFGFYFLFWFPFEWGYAKVKCFQSPGFGLVSRQYYPARY